MTSSRTAALGQMLLHLDGLDRQLDALDRDLEQIARRERWAPIVEILTRFKGISTRTALGLIAEIGDFARFSHPRELCAWLRGRPLGVLLRPATPPRTHHQDRQPTRPPAADRDGLVLPPPTPSTRPRARTRRARLASPNPPPPPLQAPHRRTRQTLDRRDRRCRPRARPVPLGRRDRPTTPPDRPTDPPADRRLTNPPRWGPGDRRGPPEDPRLHIREKRLVDDCAQSGRVTTAQGPFPGPIVRPSRTSRSDHPQTS